MTSSPSRLAQSHLAAALVLGLLGLSACSNKDERKVSTQVAAKVGSDEISVQQIDQVLSRTHTAGVSLEATQTVSREVLEKLINQKLAADQAIEKKLHRSPEVASQLEIARHEILARANLQQLAGALPKPTSEELKKYYIEHPQLFAERRVFNVQEIVVPAAAGVAKPLRGMASAGRPIEEAAAWLKSKDIKFDGGSATRAAEQIPLEVLAQIHSLKDGQSVVIESALTTTLLRLASSQLAPVTEAAALPAIEQFLTNQRAVEAMAANIKQLRATTKISYLGEFVKSESTAAAEDKTKTTLAKGSAELK